MSQKNQFSENKNNGDDGKVKRVNLTNSRDCRRFLAKIVKQILNDEIEESKARLLNNLVETILKSIRSDEIERKMLEIEKLLEEKDNDNNFNNEFKFDDGEETKFLNRVK